MPKTKFTDEQKYQIAMELVTGKIPTTEICRKYQISATYAYKLRDRAMELLREGIGRPLGRPDKKAAVLERRVRDLERLAGDQALAIRYLKKMQSPEE